jgi:hypothetical protein
MAGSALFKYASIFFCKNAGKMGDVVVSDAQGGSLIEMEASLSRDAAP